VVRGFVVPREVLSMRRRFEKKRPPFGGLCGAEGEI